MNNNPHNCHLWFCPIVILESMMIIFILVGSSSLACLHKKRKKLFVICQHLECKLVLVCHFFQHSSNQKKILCASNYLKKNSNNIYGKVSRFLLLHFMCWWLFFYFVLIVTFWEKNQFWKCGKKCEQLGHFYL